jgi:branched-chain amino acid transport system permease protein
MSVVSLDATPVAMVSGTHFLELVLNGLTIGMVYVLVAAGLSIIFGMMDVLNVSHGELLALGAYFGFSIIVSVEGVGFWVALIVAPLLVGLLGMILERLTIRPVYGRGHLAHILLTFGLLLIIYDTKQLVWGKQAKLFSIPTVIDQSVTLFGFSYSMYSYFMILSGTMLAAGTWVILNYTKFGLIIRGGSQDREMVRNLGIDIDHYYTLVFGFGAALAAFGGVVLGGYQNVNLEMGNAVIIPAFVIVVLGGLGSFRGAVIAGLFVGIVQSVIITYVPQLQGFVIFLIMIGVLLVRPYGLFGTTAATGSGRSTEPSEFVSSRTGGPLSANLRIKLGIVAVTLLALVPVFEGVLYSGFVVTLMINVLIWALFAMSLDIILGYSGLVSLGHAMFYGVGAYATILALIHLSPSVFVAVPVALVLCALLALVVGHLAIRVSGVYFVMITLAFAQLTYQAVYKLDFTGGSNGLFGAPRPLYGFGNFGIRLNEVIIGIEPFAFYGDSLFYYILLGVVIAAYLLTRRIMNAPFGSIMQAIRESETRARFIGYDTRTFKRRAFVLSGTLGGLSGAMFALYNGYAAPSILHWINSGDVIIMAVLGGTGTLYGPMIGATFFVIVEEQLSSLIPWWRLLLGVLFVLIVLFFPQGIISLPQKVEELMASQRRDLSLDDEQEVEN